MCLAVPGKVLEIGEDNMAVVDIAGVRRRVCLDLVEGIAPEDYVLVHVGFALQRIDADEAQRTMDQLLQMAPPERAADQP